MPYRACLIGTNRIRFCFRFSATHGPLYLLQKNYNICLQEFARLQASVEFGGYLLKLIFKNKDPVQRLLSVCVLGKKRKQKNYVGSR